MYGIHGFLDTDLRRGMFNCLVLDTSKVSQPFRYIQITEVVDGLLHHQQAEKLDDAKRILCAPSVWLWMKKMVESFGSDVAIFVVVVLPWSSNMAQAKYPINIINGWGNHRWWSFFEFCVLSFSGFLDFFCGRFIRQPRNDLKSRDLSSRYCMQWWYSLLYVHIYRTLIWIE